MCSDQLAALEIAAQYRSRTLEIDRDARGNPRAGYFWHYHINGKHGSPHIWFYGEPYFNEELYY